MLQGMKAVSVDLRKRILDAYAEQEGTRQEVARRFRVFQGMVKKLLQQRRRTGDIRARHNQAGRKPMILHSHRQQLRTLSGKKPDLTLNELQQALGLPCTTVDGATDTARKRWSKIKEALRAVEERTKVSLIRAIQGTLANVTPPDAINGFSSCSYGIV
jgi:transposase